MYNLETRPRRAIKYLPQLDLIQSFTQRLFKIKDIIREVVEKVVRFEPFHFQ